MKFLVVGHDGKDEGALDRRMAVRPEHFANVMSVKDRGGSVVCAGAITDEDGKLVGSYLVMDWENRAAVDEYLKTEPYVVNNVWQEITVETVAVSIQDDELV